MSDTRLRCFTCAKFADKHPCCSDVCKELYYKSDCVVTRFFQKYPNAPDGVTVQDVKDFPPHPRGSRESCGPGCFPFISSKPKKVRLHRTADSAPS